MRTIAILSMALGFSAFSTAEPVKDDAVAKEMKLLEGEWQMVSGTRNGEAIPDEQLKVLTRTFKGGEAVVLVDGKPGLKAKITIDPSKKVKTIDYELTEGENEGKKLLGIYELDGDKFKICIAQPGKDRPTDFAAKEGSEHTSSEWKRVKK